MIERSNYRFHPRAEENIEVVLERRLGQRRQHIPRTSLSDGLRSAVG